MSKLWIRIAAVGAVAAVLVTVASVAMPPAAGSLAVAVHDAPCDACSHVWVTFSSVAVHESNVSGSGWATLNVSGQTVDLAQLNGSAFAKTIGVLSLPAGHYEQIRLTLSGVVVQLVGGANLTATLGGSRQADIHGQFNVASGATTSVSIDIDLGASVHVISNGTAVVFTPNIGAVSVS